MRNTLKASTLESKFPLLSVEHGCIVSKDADGKLFVKERIEIARTMGKGWQDYKSINPTTQKTEKKTAYIEVCDNLIVAAGAYK